MKVLDIMSDAVVTATPKTPLDTVWKILFQNKVNALPVIDDKKKLVGIITKEDLLKKLYPDYIDLVEDFTRASDFEEMEKKMSNLSDYTAEQVMNTRVIFTRSDTFIMRALSRMIARRVNQLPVLDDEDRVIGMVTKGDIFYALFKKHGKKKTKE